MATVNSIPRAHVNVYDGAMQLIASGLTPVNVDVSKGGVIGIPVYLDFETLVGYEVPVQVYTWLQPSEIYMFTYVSTSLWFSCSVCGAQFSSQAELDAHVALVHGVAPRRTLAARVPMMPILALVLLKRVRDRFVSGEVHRKVHPVI